MSRGPAPPSTRTNPPPQQSWHSPPHPPNAPRPHSSHVADLRVPSHADAPDVYLLAVGSDSRLSLRISLLRVAHASVRLSAVEEHLPQRTAAAHDARAASAGQICAREPPKRTAPNFAPWRMHPPHPPCRHATPQPAACMRLHQRGALPSLRDAAASSYAAWSATRAASTRYGCLGNGPPSLGDPHPSSSARLPP